MSLNETSNATLEFPFPPVGRVGAWWAQMVAFSLFNCIFYAFTLYKTRKNLWMPPDPKDRWSYHYSFWMRLLPAPFVFQTTWRSFLPSLYNSRRTIIPGSVNSIIAARTLAFIGEICWGVQVGWALRVIGRNLPLRGSERLRYYIRASAVTVGYLVQFLAILGNIMSVAGMVSTNNVYVVVEETLWAALFLFGGIISFTLWHFGVDSWSFDYGSNCFGWDINPFDDPNKEHPYDPPSLWVLRMYVRFYALFGIAATPYMVIVDIPKWYDRYRLDEANGVQYLGFAEGFRDAANRRVASQEFADWSAEMFWMSGYFSAAVLGSIFLAYAPGRVTEEMVALRSNGGTTLVAPADDV